MNKEIFKTNRYFILSDFKASHGQLLLRSSMDDENEKNIDIIFFGTKYVQLFTSLKNVIIRIIDRKEMSKYNSINLFLSTEENFLFEIEANNEMYYIGASYVKVFENELGFNETSLGLTYEGRDKEIASSI